MKICKKEKVRVTDIDRLNTISIALKHAKRDVMNTQEGASPPIYSKT